MNLDPLLSQPTKRAERSYCPSSMRSELGLKCACNISKHYLTTRRASSHLNSPQEGRSNREEFQNQQTDLAGRPCRLCRSVRNRAIRSEKRGNRRGASCRAVGHEYRPCRIPDGAAVADQTQTGKGRAGHDGVADPVYRPRRSSSFKACDRRTTG